MEWIGPNAAEGLEFSRQLWVEGLVRFLGITLAVPLLALLVFAMLDWCGYGEIRRNFWCRLARRDVAVVFGARGPCIVSVKRCSAFEDGRPTCSRRCLDAHFRRQWQPAMPGDP